MIDLSECITRNTKYVVRLELNGTLHTVARLLLYMTDPTFDLYNPEHLACHHCDNPPCFKIEHLYHGTAQSNIRDRENRGRNGMYSRQYCKRGHEMTPKNAKGIGKNKYRRCKICHNISSNESYQRLRKVK